MNGAMGSDCERATITIQRVVPVLVVLVENDGLSKRLKRAFDAIDAANLGRAHFQKHNMSHIGAKAAADSS